MENVTQQINADAIQQLAVKQQEVILTTAINEELAKKVESLQLQLMNQKEEHERQIKVQISELFFKLSSPLTWAAEIIESTEDYTKGDYQIAKDKLISHFEIQVMSDDAQEIVDAINTMHLTEEVKELLNEDFQLSDHIRTLDKYDCYEAMETILDQLRNRH